MKICLLILCNCGIEKRGKGELEMINVARYAYTCTRRVTNVNLDITARVRFASQTKIDSCNMKLLNYVRVGSGCVIVCCYMHVLHRTNQIEIDECV